MTRASYHLGGMVLLPERELRCAGAPVALGGRALDLLSVLARAEGALVTKDELFRDVWGGSIIEENALQAQISARRKALGGEARRLVTVHGRGYRLEIDGDPLPVPAQADSASIAVLPFENIGGDPDNAYLADGLVEELITTLARVPGLKVPARTSSFAYRGRPVDIRTIARELGVATVLEGSVRSAGGRLRVAVQLIEAEGGFHRWAENFDSQVDDLIALQQSLAGAIAAALELQLPPPPGPARDGAAMHLVLKARAMSGTLSVPALIEAQRLAVQATALDPGLARAWEALAGIELVQAASGCRSPGALDEACEHAERALVIDPRLGGPHGIVASVAAQRGDWLEAMERQLRGRALDPRNPVLGENLAHTVLLPAGRSAQAAHCAQESIALGPARALPHAAWALAAWQAGDLATARAALDAALLLGHAPRFGNDMLAGELAREAGDAAGAARPLTGYFAREFDLPEAEDLVGKVIAALMNRASPGPAIEATNALFAALGADGALWRQAGVAGMILRWLALLGSLDGAFAVTRRIVARWRESGTLPLTSLIFLWTPDMAPFRADPRFPPLAEELGLPRFWRRHGLPDVDEGLDEARH